MFTVLLIAFSVSMDAFSLSLLYGTKKFNKKTIYLTSLIVGLFHFIMPLFGMTIGNIIIKYTLVSMKILSLIIFSFIGIDMIRESENKIVEEERFQIFKILLFAFTVSIDSFSVGLVLLKFTNNYISATSSFLLISMSLTFLGLKIGEKINTKYGLLSTKIGGIILILIGLFSFLSFS